MFNDDGKIHTNDYYDLFVDVDSWFRVKRLGIDY
jgi:hypothetical protein